MLNGITIENCRSCYQDENNGLESMRQHSLTKFIPIKEEPIPLEQLEVSFSNLCNLACVHCSSFFSSKWYSEDVKAKRSVKVGTLKNEFNFSTWDLSNLTELKIIGGEPFMEQEKFVELLKQLDLSKINLQICTNGTVLPSSELKELIEQCKQVYLCVSLDGLRLTNDWYRWPSKFESIIENMSKYQEWWAGHSNIKFIIHYVVNAINIFELKDFIDYRKDVLPLWSIEWDWIRWPDWQQLSVLPENLKYELIEKFEKEHKNFSDTKIPNPYNVTIERLREQNHLPPNSLLDNIKLISQERKLNYHTMLSKLMERINE